MWDKLSIKDKAKIIKMGVANGIRDLDTIRDTYNNVYAEGGDTNLLNNQDFTNQFGIAYRTPERIMDEKVPFNPNLSREDQLAEDINLMRWLNSSTSEGVTKGSMMGGNGKLLSDRYYNPLNPEQLKAYADEYATMQSQVSRKEEREIEKARTERQLAEFNSQVDSLLGFEWTMPHVVGGAVERAIERMFTGNNDFFGGRGDFFQDLLLGNSGIVTDNFAREHPNWTTGLNTLFDFAKPLYKGTMALGEWGDNFLYGPQGKVWNWMEKGYKAERKAEKFLDFTRNKNRIRDLRTELEDRKLNSTLSRGERYTYTPWGFGIGNETLQFPEGMVIPMEDGFNVNISKHPFVFTNTTVALPDAGTFIPKVAERGRKIRISNKLGTAETELPRQTTVTTLPKQKTPVYLESRLVIPQKEDESLGFFSFHNRPVIVDNTPASIQRGNATRDLAIQYIEDLNSRLGGKATVEGSTRALADGIPVSPNDIEFLMPESYYNEVKSKFNVKSETPLNNGYGYKVTGPEFDSLPSKSADFEVIKNDPKTGGAIGDTAWELYEYLHPEEAKAIKDDYLLKVGKQSKLAPSYREQPLPISAEELFEEYKNSDIADIKYLMDTQGSARNKYVQRRLDAALEGNADVYYDSLIKKAKSNLPGFKTLEEQGINLDYTNVEANKKFLEAYNLPTKYATDPKRMKIIVEQNVYATQIGQRGWGYNSTGTNPDFLKMSPEERINYELNIKNTNTGGGDAAGAGKNMTNQVSKKVAGAPFIEDVQSINQYPITYKPEEIKTAEDVLKQLEYLKKGNNRTQSRIYNEASNYTGLEEEVAQIAKEENTPFIIGEPYSDNGIYIGGLDQGGISNAAQYVGGQPHFFEPPMALHNAGVTTEYSNIWPIEKNYAKELMNEARMKKAEMETWKQKRSETLEKLRNKNRRNEIITKAGKQSIYAAAIVPASIYTFENILPYMFKRNRKRNGKRNVNRKNNNTVEVKELKDKTKKTPYTYTYNLKNK